MKIAYFDCFAGASGDMILGALLDAGLELESLKNEVAKLGLDRYDLGVEPVVKRGIGGTKAIVFVDEDHHGHHHRHLRHIEEIINGSALDDRVKDKSLAIFRRLAEAEANVHRTSVESVHFHEVGAMDAILDVVGSVIGFHLLGIERIYCSPLHVGCGTIECAHGILPVPAPATAALTVGFPVYSTGVKGELLTPTGAAILTTLAQGFGPMPRMTTEQIGYGAGTADPEEIPNLLRVTIGENASRDGLDQYEAESICVLETNIDDMNPQLYENLIEKVLAAGAVDVSLAPVQMKKNRPGTMVTILCSHDRLATLSDLLLRETTSIGLRWRTDSRIMARRTFREIDTPYGPIKVKVAQKGEEIINIMPEYEDCRRLAAEKGVPLKTVIEAAAVAAKSDLEP